MSHLDIEALLDRAEDYVSLSRQVEKKTTALRGRTQINLFFEPSTRTQASFELAGKRLGADVMNMSVAFSSVKKGETLIDTAATLSAMRPDIIVVRHHAAGAVNLLARKVGCSVINAGDGAHEHPTQALLDALTIRRNKGRIAGLTVAICGDIVHSRVARSNIILLSALGAKVRLIAPSTLLPAGVERMGVEVFRDMKKGLEGVDIAAPKGTSVYTTAEGKVIRAGFQAGGYGNFIEVKHPNGLSSVYGHLSRIDVHTGQVVASGERIGLVGSTGYSTGPHLHFEVRRNGGQVNPTKVVGQAFDVKVSVPT